MARKTVIFDEDIIEGLNRKRSFVYIPKRGHLERGVKND